MEEKGATYKPDKLWGGPPGGPTNPKTKTTTLGGPSIKIPN